MQRMTGLLICCVGLLASTATGSAEMTESSAERFADAYFYDIVMNHIRGDDPTYYHMTDSENITFGPLLETYIPSSSCYKNDETCSFIPTKEFVATVFQDDEPVNVIGTYEQAADTYGFATFGSDKEIPKALMNVQGDLVKYTEESAWFDYYGGTLIALTPYSKQMIHGNAISLKDFQAILIDEYAGVRGSVEVGMMSGEGSSGSNIKRLIGIALLFVLPFGYWLHRRFRIV